ncbi:MAG: hypothetical protein JJ863_03590 [Deltaproteobacteria bacterium]|nr:hypothetical protein [Deltaproteobacteria bacterium]
MTDDHIILSPLGATDTARRTRTKTTRPMLLLAAFLFAQGCAMEGADSGDLDASGRATSALNASPTSTPICGTSASVDGYGHAPCEALDGECQTGVFDPVNACCFVRDRPPGVACETGSCGRDGLCDGPAHQDDRDQDGVPDVRDTVLGHGSWIRSSGPALEAWEDEDTLTLFSGDNPMAEIPLSAYTAQSPLDLTTLRFARTRNQRRSAFTAVGLEGVGASALYMPMATGSRICVATEGDALATLATDCSANQALQCPSEGADGLRCEAAGSMWRIEGEELAFAWVPIRNDARDIRMQANWFRPQFPFPSAIPRRGWEWRLRFELCNGVDDDNDGEIDEAYFPDGHRDSTGAGLCNDGLTCTRDACNDEGVCEHVVRTGGSMGCQSGAACAMPVCGRPDAVDPGQRLSDELPNGCFFVLQDDLCTDTWDNCACNGVERCDPWRADSAEWSDNLGCVPGTPPTEVPCELAGGDGDGCSLETCCEDFDPSMTGCRLHRKAVERVGLAAATAAHDLACSDAARIGARTGAGGVVCPQGAFQRVVPYGSQCDDDNPCTTNGCDAPSGFCTTTSLSGPQPECQGIVNQGCGERTCEFGSCVTARSTPNPNVATDCHGFAMAENPPYWQPTCLEQQCNASNQCERVPRASFCDNGDFCDGVEVCSLENVEATGPLTGTSTSTPGVLGCGPAPRAACDDGVGCTIDRCLGPDQCQNLPNDGSCYSLRGEVRNICLETLSCDPAASTDADGCVAHSPAVNPCNDGDACTADSCSCGNELCTVPACEHTPVCVVVDPIDPNPTWPPLPPIGPIGGIRPVRP